MTDESRQARSMTCAWQIFTTADFGSVRKILSPDIKYLPRSSRNSESAADPALIQIPPEPQADHCQGRLAVAVESGTTDLVYSAAD
jgi:hypothetical protein